MTNRLLGSKLLYRGATGFEKALADTDSERLTSIDAELIRAIWDPWNCPVRLLPYLAWAYGVEFWNDDWSETTKRAWIAVQLEFKSARGKRQAIDMAVDYAGRDISRFGYAVTKVQTLPQKVFSGPSLTKAEREVWLQKLPQVRTWRIQESGTAGLFKTFYGGSSNLRLHDGRFCIGSGSGDQTVVRAPTPSTAIERLKRRARWIENGVETDITVDDFGSYFQLHKNGIEGKAVYSGRPFGLGRYFIPSTAWERLVTIAPTPRAPWRGPNTPTLQAVTSEPERVTVSGERGFSVFCDVPLWRGHGFFIPTTAPLRIFQRYAVLDSKYRELRRTPVQFMGVGRYGFPAFTAWVTVTVGNLLNPRAAGFGYMIPRGKFFIPHNSKPTDQVKLALVGAKALRDKIMLKTGPDFKFLAGEKPILAGIDTLIAL